MISNFTTELIGSPGSKGKITGPDIKKMGIFEGLKKMTNQNKLHFNNRLCYILYVCIFAYLHTLLMYIPAQLCKQAT
jgi:hypothetical protein